MVVLTFRGHSDDTFEAVFEDTTGSRKEQANRRGTDTAPPSLLTGTSVGVDNCASCEPIHCIVTAEGKSLVVTGQYDRFNNGCWDISIGMVNEGDEMPDWDMKFGFEGYSTVLKLTVPDNYTLRWFDNKDEVIRDE